MWFTRARSSGDLTAEVQRSVAGTHDGATYGFTNPKEAVQNIFSSTYCYDLMQSSSKVVVFETIIPFQLAFYALVEHGNHIYKDK